MKYLTLRDFDDITNALNFDALDCQVVGGCDVYTTKAAGSDKKLYKNIESSLESQYESLLRFSASLSPPQASKAAASLNLSRSSPFGSLSHISSRRLFAYLVATMNASNPDYDFSNYLRPSDFRREKSLRLVMNTLDTTLYNLRPNRVNATVSGARPWSSTVPLSVVGTGPTWNPKMWRSIDKELTLRECSVYSYTPDDDPYEGEEGQIWSLNYFFFNKQRKRVCYFYLRGLNLYNNDQIPKTPLSTTHFADPDEESAIDSGASKRAKYWLGDRAKGSVQSGWDDDVDNDDDDDDDDDSVPLGWEEDEPRLLPSEEHAALRMRSLEAGSPDSDRSSAMSHNLRSLSKRSRSRSRVRGISEDVTETMEL